MLRSVAANNAAAKRAALLRLAKLAKKTGNKPMLAHVLKALRATKTATRHKTVPHGAVSTRRHKNVPHGAVSTRRHKTVPNVQSKQQKKLADEQEKAEQAAAALKAAKAEREKEKAMLRSVAARNAAAKRAVILRMEALAKKTGNKPMLAHFAALLSKLK